MQTSKLKTLFILKYLEQFSDEEHPLTTTQLIQMLEKDGITCERKSIYADVKALNEIGCNIVSVKSLKKGFFMASRTFEIPEVRLLIDAVTFAGFITPNKTKALVNKLESLVSFYQAKDLTSQVYRESENKCDNEEIYYIIDNLDEAISTNKKVKFIYKRRNIDKENKKSYTTKTFNVSPYSLIWKEDHYYLVCNNEKYDNLMNLRLDRMRKIEILDEIARPVEEVSEYEDGIFDSADYAAKMFNMFSGKTEDVEIVCHLDLREEMMDRFGSKIPFTAIDNDHFSTTVRAAVSDGLVSWVMQYGNKIKVTKPESLVEKIKEKAASVISVYQ